MPILVRYLATLNEKVTELQICNLLSLEGNLGGEGPFVHLLKHRSETLHEFNFLGCIVAVTATTT